VLVHLHQFSVRYLREFAAAAPRAPRAPPPEPAPFQDVKPSDYGITKVTGAVKSLRVYISSLDSDLQFAAQLRTIQFAQLLRDDGSPAPAYHIAAEEVRLQRGDDDRPLVAVRKPSLFTACRCVSASVEAVEADLRPEELAGARLLAGELSAFRAASPVPAPRPSQIKVSIAVQSVAWTITAPPFAFDGSFGHISGGLLRQCDETVDFSLVISHITARNVSRDASFREILARSTAQQQPSTRPVQPHLRIRLKMPPKMSAHYVFSQAEVNIEPSVLSAEPATFEAVMAKFKQEYAPKRGRPAVLAFGRPARSLPPVACTADFFPIPSLKERAFGESRAAQLLSVKEETEETMMWRYFRLNGVSMDFSYKNPENKILSEIHHFQGQIHEIIYHDLTASPAALIDKLVYDVAVIMIPQFLKHCVGLKRSDITPDQAIAEWLNKDDQRMSVKDKQKMLLFGPSAKRK
jgi:hypothetical protein